LAEQPVVERGVLTAPGSMWDAAVRRAAFDAKVREISCDDESFFTHLIGAWTVIEVISPTIGI
jgi:hypothetical protein